MQPIEWMDEHRFRIAETLFYVTFNPDEYHSMKSEPGNFLLVKNKSIIQSYQEILSSEKKKYIVDIGIWQGGSVVLLDKVSNAWKIVAIDLSNERVVPLDDYVSSAERRNDVKLYYGIDQINRDDVRRIILSEGDGNGIDVIFDDASHLYEQTKSSFNALFPLLVPGGVYVVEDWGWSFTPYADLPHFADKRSPANLVLQCMALCGSGSDIVRRIEISNDLAIIERGEAPIDPDSFCIDTLSQNRGRPMTLLL